MNEDIYECDLCDNRLDKKIENGAFYYAMSNINDPLAEGKTYEDVCNKCMIKIHKYIQDLKVIKTNKPGD